MKGNGIKTLDNNYVMRYAGVSWNSSANEGVGIIVAKEPDKYGTSWEAIKSRIMSLELELETPLTLTQVYAPTDNSGAAEKVFL